MTDIQRQEEKEKLIYKRAIEFVTEMGTDLTLDVIYTTDGGNSVIMNPNTKWQEFLGHSVNSVREYVALVQGKPVKFLND